MKLNLNRLSLVVSAVSKAQYPGGSLPEFAFAGRSNVGKSSLLNRLWGRKSFARTSSVPGKTATINFYLVDDRLVFVDLPGYGYAKRPKSEVERWGRMMDDYFFSRSQLSCVVLLIDSRHAPTQDDLVMADFVRQIGKDLLVVATKVDKLKKSEIAGNLARIREMLALSEDEPMIPFSAQTGAGREELWQQLSQYWEDAE